jgi:hypothetical protein
LCAWGFAPTLPRSSFWSEAPESRYFALFTKSGAPSWLARAGPSHRTAHQPTPCQALKPANQLIPNEIELTISPTSKAYYLNSGKCDFVSGHPSSVSHVSTPQVACFLVFTDNAFVSPYLAGEGSRRCLIQNRFPPKRYGHGWVPVPSEGGKIFSHAGNSNAVLIRATSPPTWHRKDLSKRRNDCYCARYCRACCLVQDLSPGDQEL